MTTNADTTYRVGKRNVSTAAMNAILAAQPGAARLESDDDDKKKKDEEALAAKKAEDDEEMRVKKAEEDEQKKKDEEAKAKKAEDDQKEKDKQAAGYKEGEPNDQKSGRAAVAAVDSERGRIKAIIALGDAAGKPKKALRIALETDLTVAVAAVMLDDEDAPAAKGHDLRERMANVEIPAVGAGGGQSEPPKGADATAAFILAAHKQRKGG